MPLPRPPCPSSGDEPRLVVLGDEIIQVVVGFEDDVAAAPAIAAAGAAFGPELLPLESDATFAAVTGAGIDLDLVDEHVYWRVSGMQAFARTRNGRGPGLAVRVEAV